MWKIIGNRNTVGNAQDLTAVRHIMPLHRRETEKGTEIKCLLLIREAYTQQIFISNAFFVII